MIPTRQIKRLYYTIKDKLSFSKAAISAMVILTIYGLVFIVNLTAELNNPERLRKNNEAWASEGLTYTTGALKEEMNKVKALKVQEYYYKAVLKGNSETGVVRSPDTFYKLDTSKIKVDAYVIDGTASGTPVSSVPSGINKPLRPDQLFYTTNILDKCYVSQTEKQHFKSNGRLASDVACGGNRVMIYAPDFRNKVLTYRVELKQFPDTGNTVILYFEDNKTRYFWLIGHVEVLKSTKVPSSFRTGEGIGYMDLSGITSGYHSHIELWQGDNLDNAVKVSYSSSSKALMNFRQNKMQPYKVGTPIYMTHYDLGDVNQNDSSPCVGASGKNLCDLEKQGVKTVAITANVRQAMGIKFGDKVQLNGPCSGVYQVEDEMGPRFRRSCIPKEGYCIHGDIPSCPGGVHTITKL